MFAIERRRVGWIKAARSRGQLLTKEQIMEALWPGSFVEEANIPVLISSLRKVLGDSANEPYIQTVPTKGYRFTSAVSVSEPGEPPPSASPAKQFSSRNRAAIPVLALLIPILAAAAYLTYRDWPARHTLAVLPLRNLKHDPNSDFLGFSATH